MLSPAVVIGASLAYLLLLFAVAYYGDRRAAQGRSIIANPWTYALSLGVYCTAWTYFGSVGRAASGGVWFLPIYLGPTLAMVLGWMVLRKMIRIAKTYRITSIADFIGSRYGKSPLLAGLVTLIAVVGIVPYIALQLKAVSAGYALLTTPDGAAVAAPLHWIRQCLLCGAGAGGFHHDVWCAASGRHRAARGHGGGDCFRVGGQAGGLSGGGPVCGVWPV
jgi:Na+/proline symporter